MIIYDRDFERVLGYVISNIDFSKVSDFPVQYHWGNQIELNRYLAFRGENINVINSFAENEKEIEHKYPLIWLVLPNKGTKGLSDWIYHRNTQLIIAKNTKSEYLNDTRWDISFALLSDIANMFLNNIEGNFFEILRNSNNNYPLVEITKEPDYSANRKENGQVDIWDALVINVDIVLKTSCITKEIINYNYDTNWKNRL